MKKKHQKSWKNLPLEYSDLKDYIVDLSDFVKLDVLGKGSFGTVWKAQHISNGWIVAIKEFSIISNKSESSLPNDEHHNSFSENDFFNEVRILSKCANNPFFVQLVGFSIKSTYTIVTSFVPCGSLWDILHSYPENYDKQKDDSHLSSNSKQSLNDTQKNIIALGISYAMKYLHSQNIIHLDIKSPNILLDEKVLPKIADFGLSQFYDPKSKSSKDETQISTEKVNPPSCLSQKGTPKWMAPEQICGLKCGPSSDVYSFGVILYELYTGNEPYQGLNQVQIFYKVVRSNERPKLPETDSPLSRLISSCWESDPKKRPTFSEIFELFQSGEVKFPFCKSQCIKEVLRIIEKNEKNMHDAMRREAGVLNQAIAMRQSLAQFKKEEESKRYFASYAARLASQGKVNELDVLVSSIPSINLNETGDGGLTPIKAAIINDQLVIVQYFVRLHQICLLAKASGRSCCLKIPADDNNLNIKSSNQNTQINSPSFNINFRDNEGNTPFLLAVISFKPRIVAYLSKVHAVDKNAQNNNGESALHLLMKLDFGDKTDECRLVMLKALSFACDLKIDLKNNEGKEAFDGNPSLLDEFIKRQTANKSLNF